LYRCENEMVVRVVPTIFGFLPFAEKTHGCGERTVAAGTTIRLQNIGQKILAHLSPEAGDLLSVGRDDEEPCHRSKKQRPQTKEHAYIRRYYHLPRPYKATVP